MKEKKSYIETHTHTHTRFFVTDDISVGGNVLVLCVLVWFTCVSNGFTRFALLFIEFDMSECAYEKKRIGNRREKKTDNIPLIQCKRLSIVYVWLFCLRYSSERNAHMTTESNNSKNLCAHICSYYESHCSCAHITFHIQTLFISSSSSFVCVWFASITDRTSRQSKATHDLSTFSFRSIRRRISHVLCEQAAFIHATNSHKIGVVVVVRTTDNTVSTLWWQIHPMTRFILIEFLHAQSIPANWIKTIFYFIYFEIVSSLLLVAILFNRFGSIALKSTLKWIHLNTMGNLRVIHFMPFRYFSLSNRAIKRTRF